MSDRKVVPLRGLRISHSAVVDEWRGRERALADLGVDVALLTAREWHAGGVPVALQPRPGERVRGVRTWGRHPALFAYDPRPTSFTVPQGAGCKGQ